MRRPRITVGGVPQHVVQRGNNRQSTFFSERDYLFYLECLAEGAARHDCRVHAYVLMLNHVHLLVTPDSDRGVSLLMQHVGRRYVQSVNARYGRSGTLWEGRFRATLVETDRYFLACSRYIELNPVRAGVVAAPGAYRWSSYRFNATGATDTLVTPHEAYAELAADAEERPRVYARLFDDALQAKALDEIRSSVNQGWPLGSDGFRAEVERTLARPAWPPRRGRPRKSGSDPIFGEMGKSGSDPLFRR